MDKKTAAGAKDPFSFGEVLRSYRTKANLTQQGLADKLHIAKTSVRNWEQEKTQPDLGIIRELCSILGLSAAEIIGVSDPSEYTHGEKDLIGQYRQLNIANQRTVERVVDSILQEQRDTRERDLAENFFVLTHYDTPAAAGVGTPFGDDTAEYWFVRKNGFNTCADAIIGVSGRSMEPYYHDGDSVYVEYADAAQDGDDVVCSTADGAVIKRFQRGKLYSLNADMPFGERFEDDNVRILARVLGIVGKDDMASAEDIPLLEELLADEVSTFEKEHPN